MVDLLTYELNSVPDESGPQNAPSLEEQVSEGNVCSSLVVPLHVFATYMDQDRTETSFMLGLRRMLIETNAILFHNGAIIIPDTTRLERILPRYYRTCKLQSFQRQLNNFGFHRAYDPPGGVRYHKVVGSPPPRTLDELVALRPLVRRSTARKRTMETQVVRERKRPAFAPTPEANEMLTAARCLLALDHARRQPVIV